jgi:hypothetical protein
MMVDDVIARIETAVPELNKRVQGVADLAGLIAAGKLPQTSSAAWVFHAGDSAAPGTAMTGVTRQEVTETISVVVFCRVAGDSTGDKARQSIDELRVEIRDSLVGWTPASGDEEMEYRRGQVIGMEGGSVFYQMDFVSGWQLRQ